MVTRKAFSYLLISTGVLILILVFVIMVTMQVKAGQAPDLIALGKQIFRFDAFGEEDFLGGTLKLHQAIEGAQFGGVGLGMSPATPLAVGLKVDVQALPELLQNKIKKRQVDLNDPALHAYQLSLLAPVPPAGSFDVDAAMHRQMHFNVQVRCVTCHAPPLFMETGWNIHTVEEMSIDSFQADRTPDLSYRTTLIQGLWTHTKGGFYHDGRVDTLLDVVNFYDTRFTLGMLDAEKSDLVGYRKSSGGGLTP